MPKITPHWANFQVVAHAPDGRHVKHYNGWPNAERQFRSQIGHSKDPKNYMIDRLLTHFTEEQAAKLTENWTLERHVGAHGSFEVIDDWGRVITIEKAIPGSPIHDMGEG
jgi:hypothetical protein